MDCVRIKRLEIFARHGVLPEENVLGQKFLVSVDMHGDFAAAGQHDDLEASVNYAQVCQRITQVAQENTFALIERLAEVIAETILIEYPLVEKVDVEVEKPWAPVMLPVETVAVRISRSWHTCYLGIGSNMGDKKAYLDLAVEMLGQEAQTQVVRVADYITTAPVGGVEQDDFLNSAVQVRTLRTPQQMLKRVGQIEQAAHRERLVHWGPRTLDVDILLYDDVILQQEDLTIPHREMCQRQFVLEPMDQIAPHAVVPTRGCTIHELFSAITQ